MSFLNTVRTERHVVTGLVFVNIKRIHCIFNITIVQCLYSYDAVYFMTLFLKL